jgi:UDP-2,4-diacetamido-2,4,6-trideoxy-beta-L-altropyranose hydrolase
MTQHAIFRCDAGRSIGTAHLMRCLALAEALNERGWTCRFLSLPGTRAALARFTHLPAEIIEAHAVDDPDAVRALVPEGCDLFVLDSYRLGIQHETALGGWCQTSLVLDDRPFRRHAAHMLLDPTFGRAPGAYAPLVATDTRLLLGPSYALLPSAFAKARPRALARRASSRMPERIMLALGGGCGIRPALDVVLEGCRASGFLGELHVVAQDAWKLPMQRGGMRVVAHGLTVDMHRLIGACDLAIGTGGGAVWERCCLGLPTIMISAVDGPSDVAAALAEAGIVVDLGPAGALTPDAVAQALRDLADDPARLRQMAGRAAVACDGLGARRVAGALSPWLARDGEAVTLRPATMADAELLFQWEQFPVVRRHIPSPAPPTWEAHVAWLRERLADTAAGPFSIIVKGNRDVGAMRLDRCSPEVGGHRLEPVALGVSIYVEPASHGRCIATAALEAARFLVDRQPFYAEVHPDSATARRLFRRAAYSEVSPGLYRHAPEGELAPARSVYAPQQAYAQ